MKLLTLNCHAWLEPDTVGRIKRIAEAIKENQYDAIALQEVNQLIKEKTVSGKIKADNFAWVLLEELQKLECYEYKMIWEVSHIGYDRYEEGSSILTRHPVEQEYSFFVSKSKDTNFWKARKIAGVTIKLNDIPIDVYSCHLGWWHDEEEPFKEQVDILLGHVRANRLTFLMGDFNNDAFTRSEGYDYLIGQGFYDTFTLARKKDTGVTVKGKIDGWSANRKDLRLDLILANRRIDVEYSIVVFNGLNRPIVSDHYGIEVGIL